ncbi:hypothetical protein [Helicobacter cetorum]|uniref:hypothetical protein n=1 Tax=Helicobacter cetorum TaxID=138563 RepID=UPI000CF0C52B|nr:hypothetical protein [Helicobacter cetorum]
MSRLVRFKNSGILKAFNRHGNVILQHEIQAQTRLLAITYNTVYSFNGVEFGVCEGEGELDFLDYPKNLDFLKLKASVIDRYLTRQTFPSDEYQRQLLRDFMNVYEKNLEKGCYYLVPRFFKEREKELLTNKKFKSLRNEV